MTPGPTPAHPANCPDSPDYDFEVADPVGDGREFPADPRDITSIRGFGDSDTFCLTLEFSNIIHSDAPIPISFITVGFDTDMDGSTGERFGYAELGRGSNTFKHYHCYPPGHSGVDAGFVLPDPSIPATYEESSVTVELPVSAIGGDPVFDMEVRIDPSSDPFANASDCAPNGGIIHSPDGVALPPRDKDSDSHPDSVDNCPDIPGSQADTDDDGLGDTCDPSPRHEFEIVKFDGKSHTLRLSKRAAATIRWQMTVENLNPWDSPAGVDLMLPLGGLPPSCALQLETSPALETMGPLERRVIAWKGSVACEPTTERGDYIVTLDARTYQDTIAPLWGETATATMILRIR
jgi:hypothetical protein